MRDRGAARGMADGTKAFAEVTAAAAKAMVTRERAMVGTVLEKYEVILLSAGNTSQEARRV